MCDYLILLDDTMQNEENSSSSEQPTGAEPKPDPVTSRPRAPRQKKTERVDEMCKLIHSWDAPIHFIPNHICVFLWILHTSQDFTA